ncbi:hypothetical protein PsgRace4_04316 [Pseudomonas savastanoi pv. glycinea str. race 4]|nr:hypothetical protein PsgRace4_04316 [Pseudomonas savastanoi pv. glycinea str. race 4]
MKVQASRVGILPARIEAVHLSQNQHQQSARSQPVQNQADPALDFDDDIPV